MIFYNNGMKVKLDKLKLKIFIYNPDPYIKI